MMKEIMITIEFPNKVKREYSVQAELVERIMKGFIFTIEAQHPDYSETFKIEVKKDK